MFGVRMSIMSCFWVARVRVISADVFYRCVISRKILDATLFYNFIMKTSNNKYTVRNSMNNVQLRTNLALTAHHGKQW